MSEEAAVKAYLRTVHRVLAICVSATLVGCDGTELAASRPSDDWSSKSGQPCGVILKQDLESDTGRGAGADIKGKFLKRTAEFLVLGGLEEQEAENEMWIKQENVAIVIFAPSEGHTATRPQKTVVGMTHN